MLLKNGCFNVTVLPDVKVPSDNVGLKERKLYKVLSASHYLATHEMTLLY